MNRRLISLRQAMEEGVINEIAKDIALRKDREDATETEIGALFKPCEQYLTDELIRDGVTLEMRQDGKDFDFTSDQLDMKEGWALIRLPYSRKVLQVSPIVLYVLKRHSGYLQQCKVDVREDKDRDPNKTYVFSCHEVSPSGDAYMHGVYASHELAMQEVCSRELADILSQEERERDSEIYGLSSFYVSVDELQGAQNDERWNFGCDRLVSDFSLLTRYGPPLDVILDIIDDLESINDAYAQGNERSIAEEYVLKIQTKLHEIIEEWNSGDL